MEEEIQNECSNLKILTPSQFWLNNRGVNGETGYSANLIHFVSKQGDMVSNLRLYHQKVDGINVLTNSADDVSLAFCSSIEVQHPKGDELLIARPMTDMSLLV